MNVCIPTQNLTHLDAGPRSYGRRIRQRCHPQASVARYQIKCQKSTVRDRRCEVRRDVLGVARVAGIQALKERRFIRHPNDRVCFR